MIFLIEFILGFYLADLVTGIIHMCLDYETIKDNNLRIHTEKNILNIINFKNTNNIYKNSSRRDKFIWNFQSHHDVPYPKADTDLEEFYKIDTWLSMIFPILFPLISLFIFSYDIIINNMLFRIYLFSLPFILLSQKIHFLSHARNHNDLNYNKKINKIIYWMQDYHIILNPIEHKEHHLKFNCNFCIVNGWANPLLNKIVKILIKFKIIGDIPNTLLIRKERNLKKN